MKINEITIVIFIFYIYRIVSLDLNPPRKFVSMLNVGQGDAIYIKDEKISILIDTGENYESTYGINKYYFPGTCRINYVFITHPHFDHLGGLERLAKICQIDTFIFNDINYDSEAYYRIYDLVDEKNHLKTYVGDEFKTKNFYIKTIWPTEEFLHAFNNVNDTSIVQLLDSGDFEVLLTGDVEQEALNKIDFDQISGLIDGRLDVFKVCHHGSRAGLSKEIVEKFRPIYCVISCGEDNKFGHPHQEVVDYLENHGCKVLRTDQQGTVTFYIK